MNISHRNLSPLGDVGNLNVNRESERGASLVEYVLLMALIAIVCLAAVSYFGTSTGGNLQRSGGCIEAAGQGLPAPAGCP